MAQVMWDTFAYCFFEAGKMHADPNPGNYLFTDNHCLGLLDFGSIKTYDIEFRKNVSKVLKGYISSDFSKVKEVYLAFGISPDRIEDVFIKYLKPFGEWLSVPFKTATFDFGANPDHCEKGVQIAFNTLKSRGIEGFTSENVMFDRNIHGLFRIFTQMKAKVSLQNKWIYS